VLSLLFCLASFPARAAAIRDSAARSLLVFLTRLRQFAPAGGGTPLPARDGDGRKDELESEYRCSDHESRWNQQEQSGRARGACRFRQTWRFVVRRIEQADGFGHRQPLGNSRTFLQHVTNPSGSNLRMRDRFRTLVPSWAMVSAIAKELESASGAGHLLRDALLRAKGRPQARPHWC
jgi:hypothetical protein